MLEMIDKREQAPDLPVMVYLENEVLELGDAEVYFNPENKDAARDVDLLLATQGWRRFILVDYNKIKKLQPEAAKRVLAENQSLVVVRKLRITSYNVCYTKLLRHAFVDIFRQSSPDIRRGKVDDTLINNFLLG